MKFLVDAQLPRRLAALLQQAGHDAAHSEGFDAFDFIEINQTELIFHS